MILMIKFLPTAALVALVLGAATITSLTAPSPEPGGTWSTEGGKATVRIAACGAALCGTIVALKEPNDSATGRPLTDKNNPDPNARTKPMIGVQIVLGMRPSGTPNKWSGQVYNAEDGKTYTGYLTLENANTIKLEGCILGGMICKTQTWTRASGGRA
jgi:uncharacterized protein (DUF2147 family)